VLGGCPPWRRNLLILSTTTLVTSLISIAIHSIGRGPSDPINIRYATDTSNMQVYALHNPCRYVYVPVEGSVVLFDFKACGHLSADHPTVDEVREATSW